LPGLDKSFDNAFYEFWIDPETQLPTRIRYLVFVAPLGQRKEKEPVVEKQTIAGGKHYVFHFDFHLSNFGELKPLEMPRHAQKLLSKIKG